ncbi:hypothetical protein [Novosphingobium sp. PP1Y]|uniref:hypothetical protein n=1 Tax=Novosphingobium sp. PP1Y TaxID=702113 RepID=UPI00020EFDF2|nr:hypothetical protein [Novosphingobium sp. PP1Y]CCA90966.1 conserved hypothetical protein [Novosphingobium sp. PP1Y]
MQQSRLARLHAPTLWLSGDPSDIAHKNAQADFAAVAGLPAAWVWHEGTGHAEHYRKVHGGEFVEPVVSWLDWQLKGVRSQGAMFKSADCGLCTQSGWHVSTKALDDQP